MGNEKELKDSQRKGMFARLRNKKELPVFSTDAILFDHKKNHEMIRGQRYGSVYPTDDIREYRKMRKSEPKHISSFKGFGC